VVDPTTWISYKFLTPSLVDTETTCFNMADACVQSGTAGCKLMDFLPSGSDKNDVGVLLNGAHDLALELYRKGIEIPTPSPTVPGAIREFLLGVLNSPTAWADHCNNDVAPLIALIHQTAQAHNVTLKTGLKINVPSGKVSFDRSRLAKRAPGALTSYSSAAIAGADNFNDGSASVSNVFDTIVANTRQITPTFGTVWGTGYTSYGWPVRSVEQLTPYVPKKLTTPALIIGNTDDPITPYSNAKSTAAMLGENAYLVEQLGSGHTSLAQRSSCTIGVMLNYVSSSTLPAQRTSQCAVDPQNFFPALAGNTTVTKRAQFLRRWW